MNKNNQWGIFYTKGSAEVVFHTSEGKPSSEEFWSAIRRKEQELGREFITGEYGLWGPV